MQLNWFRKFDEFADDIVNYPEKDEFQISSNSIKPNENRIFVVAY